MFAQACISRKSKFKIIRNATKKKYTIVFVGPVLKEGRLKSINIPSYSSAHGEFENLCFASVAPMVCMSRVFVYNEVNVNKIVIVSTAHVGQTFSAGHCKVLIINK